MLNRGLSCVVRPNEFDFYQEQQVDPVSGYGIIPLLMAAGGAVTGALDSKAKKKQAKKDAKQAKLEMAAQQKAEAEAASRRNMLIIASIVGVVLIGGIAFASTRKKRK